MPPIPAFIQDPELGVVEVLTPDMPPEQVKRINEETKRKIDEADGK